MARSVHTRPRSVLAPSRVRAPHERRSAAGLSRTYRRLRMYKEQGICPEGVSSNKHVAPYSPLPRVSVSRAPGESHYPVTRSDIVRLLRFFGPEVTYGLRSIELRPVSDAPDRLRFGTLVVPGQIRLFAQNVPPWTLHGTLSIHELERLACAGADMEIVGDGLQTIVDWPGNTLRDFFLFDVLMHEVGHHIVQQYTGKRCGRVLRTKDHETFADRFARRCREEYARS